MSIEFNCTECNKRLRVADQAVDKKARCPDCGTIQDVPPASIPEGRPLPQVSAPAPGSGNPFASDASPFAADASRANPYQSPASAGSYLAPASRQVIEEKVRGPATALAVLAAVMLVLAGVGLLAQVGIVAAARRGGEELVFNVVGFVIAEFVNFVVLFGALKMKRLENYALAVTASVLAMLPCFSCCILGLPFGVWSLVVLSDPQVRSAFQ